MLERPAERLELVRVAPIGTVLDLYPATETTGLPVLTFATAQAYENVSGALDLLNGLNKEERRVVETEVVYLLLDAQGSLDKARNAMTRAKWQLRAEATEAREPGVA